MTDAPPIHQWSVTARPFRLGDPQSKDMTMTWQVPAPTAADALAHIALQLADQPPRKTITVTIEQTDA